MYLEINNELDWAIDIEGDGLPSTVVWCVCAVNLKTDEEWSSTDYSEIKEWFDLRGKEGCKFIAHNGLGYDFPTLNKLVGTKVLMSQIKDSLLYSMCYSPSLEGGHGLEAWGVRLRFPKGNFNDFSAFSPEMLTYCLQDARLCKKVYQELTKRMLRLGFTNAALDLEHKAWKLLKQQHQDGFAFDFQGALGLYATLREKENGIRDDILKVWPPKLEKLGTYKRPFKKDGTPSSNYLRHVVEYDLVQISDDRSEYSVFGPVSFNIGSPLQRVEKLLELGWIPREFTKETDKGGGGNPKVTDKGRLVPSLEEFVEVSDHPGPRLIAHWIEFNARANMINTWMEAYDERTGCIHGTLWLANTFRYRHSGPNTANIPAVRLNKQDEILYREEGVFTYEARDLWISRDRSRRRMVGVDAKGIQLRILAHYLNSTAFTEAVLSKDPHAANQKAMALPSRALAKTIIYAILMGAGDPRISKEANVSLSEARKHKKTFFDTVPVRALIDRLKNELRSKGRISLCDGTPVLVSSDHMVIPYLLQGDESKIMKFAMIRIAQQCRNKKIDAIQVGMIHDELQFDVLEKDVTEFIRICLDAFVAAGKYYNYNIPIEGDTKVGLTWAETH